MRVVHCMPIFSELTQTFIYELLVNLQEQEPDLGIRVLTWQRRNPDERPFEPVDTVPPPSRSELLRIRLGRAAPAWWERRLWPLTRFERAIAARLRALDASLVHAHFGPTGVLVARACAEAGVPLVLTFRGRDASAKLHKARWRRLYRRTLVQVAAVTCVAEDLRRRLQPVLPPGVEPRVILGGKQPRQLQWRAPPVPRGRLLSIGRLIEKKGHDDAIRALARARALGADASLTIIGEGPLRAALEREIAEHGLAGTVTLAGALPFRQVVEHLHAADILVAANRTASNGDREGIPNVVKEAQLVGLPVAGTRHGGIPQAVPETARAGLVGEGDVDALAARIVELLGSDRAGLERIARAGREHVLALFDPGSEARAYRELYESLVAGAGTATRHRGGG